MRAAVLHEYGAPRFGSFAEPVPGGDAVVVDVAAAALNPLDLARASETFYMGPPPLPSVAGSDAVGRLADGRRVYVDTRVAPFGSMAERTLVPAGEVMDVAEGVADDVAVALGNPGVAGWLALERRAALRAGETVLVLGATGTAGRLAVQIARILGAGRVVAAGRDVDVLARVRELGADATVVLGGDAASLPDRLREACDGGADVIVDFIWGPPALAALQSAARDVRLVQLGQGAGVEVPLPAPLVRARNATIIGHAAFHLPRAVVAAAYLALTRHAADGRLEVDIERVPLEQVEDAWERQQTGRARARIVLIP